jgi:hypothetical protein
MKKRNFLLTGLVILGSGLVFSVLTIASPRQDRKITISLSEQEWNIVLQGLSELPMKVSGAVYSNILSQAQVQYKQSPILSNKDSTSKKKQ